MLVRQPQNSHSMNDTLVVFNSFLSVCLLNIIFHLMNKFNLFLTEYWYKLISKQISIVTTAKKKCWCDFLCDWHNHETFCLFVCLFVPITVGWAFSCVINGFILMPLLCHSFLIKHLFNHFLKRIYLTIITWFTVVCLFVCVCLMSLLCEILRKKWNCLNNPVLEQNKNKRISTEMD